MGQWTARNIRHPEGIHVSANDALLKKACVKDARHMCKIEEDDYEDNDITL